MVEKECGEETPAYLALNASFVHFMVVQVAAIFIAILGKYQIHDKPHTLMELALSAVGFCAFSYALLTAVATTFGLLRIAQMFNRFRALEQENKTAQEEAKQNEKTDHSSIE